LEYGVSGEETHWRKELKLNTRRNIMKSLGRAGLLFLFVVVCTLMMVSQSQAKVSSHKINAKGVGLFTPDGTGTGGTDETRIIGGGLLQGTASGDSVVVGFDFPVLSLVGTQMFTTNKGTLTVDISGDFNVVTGEFILSGPVTDATGKLEGAEGFLLFEGVEAVTPDPFDPEVFVEDITGVITVDLSPKR
jgi:hypothetical protein